MISNKRNANLLVIFYNTYTYLIYRSEQKRTAKPILFLKPLPLSSTYTFLEEEKNMFVSFFEVISFIHEFDTPLSLSIFISKVFLLGQSLLPLVHLRMRQKFIPSYEKAWFNKGSLKTSRDDPQASPESAGLVIYFVRSRVGRANQIRKESISLRLERRRRDQLKAESESNKGQNPLSTILYLIIFANQ